jgi:GTPase
LIGLGHQLSRLGGGIGTRGPGETQLEVDRRVIRKKIVNLKKDISAIRKHRQLHRQRRLRNRCYVVNLVGYTNAGKSTLLNSLTGANLYTEDKLFATLDPSIKRGNLNNGAEVLFTDTVGFIEKLPRQLIAAFKATLEEIAAGDLLLHVVDTSHPNYTNQIAIVREHLKKIDPEYYLREQLVFNKIDLLNSNFELKYLEREFPGALFLSALQQRGLNELKEKIAILMSSLKPLVRVYLPYSAGKILSEIQDQGNVKSVEYKSNYIIIEAVVEADMAKQLKVFCSPPTL